MSTSQFRAQAPGRRQRPSQSPEPVHGEVGARRLTRAQLGAWAAQHYQYVSQFRAGAPRSTAGARSGRAVPAREHHRGGVRHQARRPADPLRGGVRRLAGKVESKQQLPTTRGLTAWCFEMSHQPFHVAAAGLLVGLESQVPGIYQRNLPPL